MNVTCIVCKNEFEFELNQPMKPYENMKEFVCDGCEEKHGN